MKKLLGSVCLYSDTNLSSLQFRIFNFFHCLEIISNILKSRKTGNRTPVYQSPCYNHHYFIATFISSILLFTTHWIPIICFYLRHMIGILLLLRIYSNNKNVSNNKVIDNKLRNPTIKLYFPLAQVQTTSFFERLIEQNIAFFFLALS